MTMYCSISVVLTLLLLAAVRNASAAEDYVQLQQDRNEVKAAMEKTPGQKRQVSLDVDVNNVLGHKKLRRTKTGDQVPRERRVVDHPADEDIPGSAVSEMAQAPAERQGPPSIRFPPPASPMSSFSAADADASAGIAASDSALSGQAQPSFGSFRGQRPPSVDTTTAERQREQRPRAKSPNEHVLPNWLDEQGKDSPSNAEVSTYSGYGAGGSSSGGGGGRRGAVSAPPIVKPAGTLTRTKRYASLTDLAKSFHTMAVGDEAENDEVQRFSAPAVLGARESVPFPRGTAGSLGREMPALRRETPELGRETPVLGRSTPGLGREPPGLVHETPGLDRETSGTLRSTPAGPNGLLSPPSFGQPSTVRASDARSGFGGFDREMIGAQPSASPAFAAGASPFSSSDTMQGTEHGDGL